MSWTQDFRDVIYSAFRGGEDILARNKEEDESSSKRFDVGGVITAALHNVSLTTLAGLLTVLPRVTLDRNRAFDARPL